MESITFEMEKEPIQHQAEEFFLQSGGLTGDGEKAKRMRMEAFRIRDEIQPQIRIRGIFSYSSEFKLEGDVLKFESTEFRCNGFSLINPQAVKAVYVTVLTAGEVFLDDRGILDQLYADMWGTSYLDAGRNALRGKIRKNYADRCLKAGESENILVSESFGPGFYGMDAEETSKIFRLIDPSEIGMSCGENGFMKPLKSCAGLYLIVDDPTALPGIACENCIGSRISCNSCNVRKSI